MPSANDYIDYLLELLAPLGDVRAKRMFGGHGIYQGDLMFGLVANETFYLKVDAGNKSEFEAQDLPPFTYEKNGKTFNMSYHRAPDAALEDSALLCGWARSAIEAARRSRKPKKATTPPAKRKTKTPASKA